MQPHLAVSVARDLTRVTWKAAVVISTPPLRPDELPMAIPKRGLTLLMWTRHAIEAGLDRVEMLETLMSWPRTPEAHQTLDELTDVGLLSEAELSSVRQARTLRSQEDCHPGYAGRERHVRVLNGVVRNIHQPYQCHGRACWIHAPSEHALLDWPVHFWDTTASAERVCQHWSTHPDPDDLAWRRLARPPISEHICDCGCCR